MKYYTTISQSKKLLSLGLSPESADMFYQYIQEQKVINSIPVVAKYIKESLAVPCWSVGALLDLLPEEIKYQDEWCSLELAKNWISYEGCDRYDASYRIQPFAFDKKPFIELLFEAICWLLENNYLKTEK